MLKQSKKAIYAVVAVLDIASHPENEPIRIGEICQRHGMPPRYLEAALQRLVHQGILVGVRGPRGGYLLARDRSRITIGEIVRVIKGMEQGHDPVKDGGASRLGRSVIRPLAAEILDYSFSRLDSVTVADLCRRAENLGACRDRTASFDYCI